MVVAPTLSFFPFLRFWLVFAGLKSLLAPRSLFRSITNEKTCCVILSFCYSCCFQSHSLVSALYIRIQERHIELFIQCESLASGIISPTHLQHQHYRRIRKKNTKTDKMSFNNRKFSMNRSTGAPRLSSKSNRRFSTHDPSANGMFFTLLFTSLPFRSGLQLQD